MMPATQYSQGCNFNVWPLHAYQGAVIVCSITSRMPHRLQTASRLHCPALKVQNSLLFRLFVSLSLLLFLCLCIKGFHINLQVKSSMTACWPAPLGISPRWHSSMSAKLTPISRCLAFNILSSRAGSAALPAEALPIVFCAAFLLLSCQLA
jgi:cytochrome b561